MPNSDPCRAEPICYDGIKCPACGQLFMTASRALLHAEQIEVNAAGRLPGPIKDQLSAAAIALREWSARIG